MVRPEAPSHLEDLDDSMDALEAFNPEVPVAPRAAAVPVESTPVSAAIVPPVKRNTLPFEPPRSPVLEHKAPSATPVPQAVTHNRSSDADDSHHPSFDAARGRVANHSSVSLAALIAAGFRPDADETIAIGHALCRSSTGSSQQADSVNGFLKPDLNKVLVDATGQVLIVEPELRTISESVWTIATLLLEILPRDSHWLFRTRILSTAVSSPHSFTLTEFEQELSVYASADSAGLICALYDRWFTRHGKLADTVSPAPAIAEVVKTPHEAPLIAKQRVRTVQVSYTLAAAIAAAVVLVVGASIFRGSRRADIPALAPLPVAAAVIPTVLTSVASDVPTPRLIPAAKISVNRPVAGERRARSIGSANDIPTPARNTPADGVTPAQRILNQQATDAPSEANGRIHLVAEMPAPSALEAPVQVQAAVLAPAVPEAMAAGPIPRPDVIYSKADERVTPPVPVVPRRAAGLRPQSPDVRWDLLSFEVVIDTTGRVETVRGLVRPRNMAETLLLTQALSALKSWPFKPATKDGLPVAYRQIVELRDLTRDVP